VGAGESDIAARLEDFEDNLPSHIKLAYLPNLGQVRVRLSGTGDDLEVLNRELDERVQGLADLIPELIFGREKEQLEEVIGRMLRERGLTLGTAESCTGGYVAHRITSIPGSSAYFMGSAVTYTNELKMKLLHVKSETLEQHGAVSEQTVREMVRGALPLLGVDIAIAASGIAGPGGGTPEKPVGLVWIAVGNKDRVVTRKLLTGKDRLKNIHYTSVMAMDLLRRFVLEHYAKTVV
jgi:nicotinamide-nucleotide amidase